MAVRNPVPTNNSGGSYLPPYEYLRAGQNLRSPNGRYHLEIQPDGVAVIYDVDTAVWVASPSNGSETYNTEYWETRFINMYNLRLQDGTRKRTWSSRSNAAYTGAGDFTYLYLQDDGNLVSVAFAALWAINTSIFQIPFGNEILVIAPGTDLEPGKFYTVGDSRLVFQGDGNLVLYGKNNAVIWASYTQDKGGVRAVMQTDGNFVIYTAAGVAIWATGTAGQPGAYLQIQANGNLMVASQIVIWARFGFTPVNRPVKVFYPDHSTGPFPTFKEWSWSY